LSIGRFRSAPSDRARFLFGRSDGAFETGPDKAVVCGKVRDAILLWLVFRPGYDNVRKFGDMLLRGAKQIGVEAELENCAAFRLPREFRIDDLVRPGPKLARRLDAL